MIVALRDLMRGRLPSGLRPRIESRVYLEETDPDGHVTYAQMKPDAFVVEYPKSYPGPQLGAVAESVSSEKADGGALLADPITFTALPIEMKERYIDIVDVNDGDRIVTSIEVLSPANKTPGVGFDLFRKKQDAMRSGRVSLLEIDLIRGGARAISAPQTFQDAGPDILYRIAVLPSWRLLNGDLYALTLRHRLPVINLPLRKTDPPLSLDLQLMHDIAYDRGEFAVDVDYRKEPEPRLSKEDEAWSDKMLKSKGLR